jgi:serine protease Do
MVILILLSQSINALRKEVALLSKKNQEVTSELQKKIEKIEQDLKKISGENEKVVSSIKILENKESVKQKTQEELITEAVAKIAPSVVSIVATKDVPKIEVVYQNPFGDDPIFRQFNIQVPILKQKGTEKREVGAGTGFVITNDGFIITNKHVVLDQKATYSVFMSDGKSKEALVVYRDTEKDLALLKINGENYKPAIIGKSSISKLGQTVMAIGNALGEYDNSVSVGIISGLNRNITAEGENGLKENLQGVMQTDAAINPGNSGGPLVDIDGKVIGINVATAIGSNNIGFAIPIDQVKGIVQKFIGRNL